LRDIVQADAAVRVNDDAKDTAPADRPDRDDLEVDIQRAEHGFDQAGNPRRFGRARRIAAVAGTRPAAVWTRPTAARTAAAPSRDAAARLTPCPAPARGPDLPWRAAPGTLAHHASYRATRTS